MKERRIGTFSLGVVLLVYGVLFLISTYVKSFSFYFVFRLWPFIFIVLGVEISYSAVRYKEENYRYDFAAILLICILMIFAMSMGGMDWLYQHGYEWYESYIELQ